MKSGKFTLGYRTCLKTMRSGKAKLVIVCSNCPPVRKSEIEYYAMLSKTGVHHYAGSEHLSRGGGAGRRRGGRGGMQPRIAPCRAAPPLRSRRMLTAPPKPT